MSLRGSASVHLPRAYHAIAMLLRPTLLVLALAAPGLASGEPLEPLGRIARLSYVQGDLTFQGAEDTSPSALPDRPLLPGDHLATGRDGRAELAFGSATLRLDKATAVTIADLGVTSIRLELAAGTASLHLHELLEGETFAIATPDTTITFQAPGEYRVDVPAGGATDLTVRTGAADVTTADGFVRVADSQRVRLDENEALANLAAPRPADAFDDWVLEREVELAEAAPPRGEPTESYAYADETLDQYGEWRDEPDYGRVWMPSYAYGGWDPFRYGYWQRSSFGWSWYDPMPWSHYTNNHGRWAYVRGLDRWCWVPSRRDHRRRVANDTQDTRPYRYPNDTNRRENEPEDRPRNANPRRNDGESGPVAASSGLPRRIDADRAPVFRRDTETGKPTRRTAPVPVPAPRTNQDSSPPPRSAPVAQGGGTTMRPSRPASSSDSDSSSSSSSSSSQAAPRPTMAPNKGFAKPQEP